MSGAIRPRPWAGRGSICSDAIRHIPNGATIRLKWVDGVFENATAPAGITGTIKRRGIESVFLELLRKMETARRLS